jgi:hypothetical protein
MTEVQHEADLDRFLKQTDAGRWYYINIAKVTTGTDNKFNEAAASLWCEKHFGDNFFTFGHRFWFAKDEDKIAFVLAWT